MKTIFSLLLFLLTTFSAFAQVDSTFYPELLNRSVIDKALELEEKHPSSFYEAAGVFFEKEQFNEAGFLFYLGQLRYRYYLNVNNNLDPSEDPALFASLQSTVGSEINYKLGEDIENLILILEAVIKWGENVDYEYLPVEEHEDTYNEILTGLKSLRDNLIDRKDEIIRKRNQN